MSSGENLCMSEATSSVVLNKWLGVAVAADIKLTIILKSSLSKVSLRPVFVIASTLSTGRWRTCIAFTLVIYINSRSTLVQNRAAHPKSLKHGFYPRRSSQPWPALSQAQIGYEIYNVARHTGPFLKFF